MHRNGGCNPRWLYYLGPGMFVIAVVVFRAPAAAQSPTIQVLLALQRERANAAVGTDRGSLVRRYSFLDQAAEEADQDFSFSVSASAFYDSNAEAAATNGTSTVEGNPEIRLAWSKQVTSWTTLSALIDGSSSRFVRSQGADGDTAYAQLQAQFGNPDEDQALAPFVSYSPSLAFAPTFSAHTSTSHDLAIGFDKMFNFNYGWERLNGPDTASRAYWSVGLTGTATRSIVDASPSSPSSYSISLAPSLTFNGRDPDAPEPEAQMSWSFELPISRLFYDRSAGFSRRDWVWSPILTWDYSPPLRWFKWGNANEDQAQDRYKALGAPTLSVQAAFSQLNSNEAGPQFHQWTIGPTLKLAWSF